MVGGDGQAILPPALARASAKWAACLAVTLGGIGGLFGSTTALTTTGRNPESAVVDGDILEDLVEIEVVLLGESVPRSRSPKIGQLVRALTSRPAPRTRTAARYGHLW